MRNALFVLSLAALSGCGNLPMVLRVPATIGCALCEGACSSLTTTSGASVPMVEIPLETAED